MKPNQKNAVGAQALSEVLEAGQPAPAANSSLVFLAEIANGALVAEMSEALREIHDRMTELPGKAMLTLKVGFAGEGTGQVAIAYEIATKVPKLSSPRSLAYLSGDGRFVRNDPAQAELPLIHRVEGPERPKIHASE